MQFFEKPYRKEGEEHLVALAAERFFALYVHDWAENHHLSAKSEEILIEGLKDSFFFMNQFAEVLQLKSDSKEMLIEILKDSFFFIQQFLDSSKDQDEAI